MDEFDDIFLDSSDDEDHGTNGVGKECTQERGGKKMEEDVLARVRKANDVEERDQKRKDKKRKSVGEEKEVDDDMFDDFEG